MERVKGKTQARPKGFRIPLYFKMSQIFSGFTTHFFVQAISNRSCSWLINNSEHIETSNGSGIFCSLTLGVIEISWDCDHGICNSLKRGKKG